MHIIQSPLFDFEAFIATKGNDRLVMVLEALNAEKLIGAGERTLDRQKGLLDPRDVVCPHYWTA